MANTNSPSISTRKQERLSFVDVNNMRDSYVYPDKDPAFINCYPNLIHNPITNTAEIELNKRPGLNQFFTTAAGTPRGIFFWELSGLIYWVIGSTLYSNSGGVSTPLQVLSTSTGKVGFVSYVYNSVYYLVVLDGTSGWVISTTNVVTQITDADFPSPHLVTPVYIDGYLLVVKTATQDIYNCDLGNPLSWTPGNFISAEMYGDNLIAIIKNKNFCVALGQSSTEFLYDAAIASGSPFQRYDSPAIRIGCANINSIAQTEEDFFFVGTTASGALGVFYGKNFTITEITPFGMAQDIVNSNITFTSNTAYGNIIRFKNKTWYALNLANKTWVFDVELKTWFIYTSDYTGSTSSLPSNYFTSDYNGTSFCILSGIVAYVFYTAYSDFGTPIQVQIRTKEEDFGTINRKTFEWLTLLTDWEAAVSTPIYTTIYWSDDNYQTWSPGKQLQINQKQCQINKLGMARRRAFKITYSDNYPLRIKGLELSVNVGQS